VARLSPREKSDYAEKGYVVPSWSFPQRRIDDMRAALDRLIADNPSVRPEKLVSAHLENGKEGVKGSRAFLELAQDPELVELISDAIGADVILWGCQVFCKPGGDGLETPFHQDGHYWPIRPLATCTAWIALDPSKRENGCLKVVPGSHRDKKLFPHLHEDREDLVLTNRIQSFDESSAVNIELEPGQMSLHDIYMIHGATVNRSPMRRAGVAIRYMPGSSVFDRNLMPASSSSGYLVDFSTRPLWLLKGQDRTGRNDFHIGK
jgi:ectoine hydroxylase-related dioxygenase (phytanoyl-CoA dioxygenase family)